MTLNIKRFQADIDRLIDTAALLEVAMLVEILGVKRFKAETLKDWKEEDAKALLEKCPNFKTAYEAWYSEAVALLKQVLPDRVGNFVSHYEVPKGRKKVEFGTYRMQDYQQGLQVTRAPYNEVIVDGKAALPEFRNQVAILKAAQKRFTSSLFEIKQIVQADLFDSEIEAARELLKNGFLRAAGAIAGVVLEKHLRQVCEDHRITIIKKHPTINDLNELLRSNNVIDMPQWRHITLLGDLRNLCDHNKQREPTPGQVNDLIDGTDKVLKTVA